MGILSFKPGFCRAFFCRPFFADTMELALAGSLAFHLLVFSTFFSLLPKNKPLQQILAGGLTVKLQPLAAQSTSKVIDKLPELDMREKIPLEEKFASSEEDSEEPQYTTNDIFYYPRSELDIPPILDQPLLLPPASLDQHGKAVVRIYLSRFGRVDRIEIESSDVDHQTLLPMLEVIAASHYQAGIKNGVKSRSLIRMEILLNDSMED